MAPLSVLALDPWYAGSHARFLDGWSERSVHAVQVIGLPGRFWSWRMAAGAWELARRIERNGTARPDVIVASDFVDLPGLRGFLPAEWRDVPAIVYFHENQLTYPKQESAHPADFAPGFTNILSCLAADRVIFNSGYHLRAFAQAAEELLARLPKPNPRAALAAALAQAHVVSPGVDVDQIPVGTGGSEALRVVFNHRWEYDKDPIAFLRAAHAAAEAGAELELILLGERFETLPEGSAEWLQKTEAMTVHQGFAHDRAHYAELLGSADLVASTAQHEFFGISAIEGLAAGCSPLLPKRLSYPDVLPEEWHAAGLYADDADLTARMIGAAAEPGPLRDPLRRQRLRSVAAQYSMENTAQTLDDLCAASTLV